MLEIRVTLEAPELAAAISALANSTGAHLSKFPAAAPLTQTAVTHPVGPVPPAQPSVAVMPAATAYNQPLHQPQPPAHIAPAQPLTTPPAAVPVAAAPAYTHDQIMKAGAALVDAGRMNELAALLNTFGVQAVTQLKPEQFGVFATELRKMGAVL